MPLKISPISLAPKENSLTSRYCDHVVKISIYVLVFLIPLFFAPWTYGVGDFSKQALLIAVSFVSLAAWMVKTLVSGKFTIKLHSINLGIVALVLVSGLSIIFSVAKYTSFWGASQVFSQSFISVLAYATIYFLISNNFLKKDIEKSLLILGISSALVMIYGILQIFGFYIIPVGFTQNNSFNTIGSLGSFGFFAVVLFPLWTVFSIITKKWWRVLFVFNIFLTLAVLLLVNYYFLWLVSLFASLVLILFWIIRKDIFDVRWMFLPTFFLIVSLFFVLLSPKISWLPQNPLEVSLSSKASIEINMRGLKSFEFFGSGPGNFAYDFAKYKNQDFNQSPLWNINFVAGASKVLTGFAEIGIIGFIIMMISMALPIFYGAKYFINQGTRQEPHTVHLVLVIFAVVATQTFGYFLYNANISLDFIYFFFIASLVVLLGKNSKEYVLKSASLLVTVAIFIFALVLIFDVGVLFLEGQRYVADMQYRKGLTLFSQDKKDESLQYLKKAANNGHSDLYFNQLSLFSLVRVQDYLSVANPDNKDNAKQAVPSLIIDAINSSNASVSLSPKNFENWLTKGYVCQSLLGLSTEAPNCAIESYDRAIALNPNSPYLFLQQGNIYLTQAVTASDQTQKNDWLSKANEKFNKAIELKTNYALAYFQLAMVLKLQEKTSESAMALEHAQKYSMSDASLLFQVGLSYYQDKNWLKAQDNFQRALILIPRYANALYFSGLAYEKQGQKDDAIYQFSKLLELNVNKENIQKMIDNIKAGRPALEGLAQQPPVPVASPVSP